MTLKVLIVEDDLSNLELMNEILCSAELQVRPIIDSEIASALACGQGSGGRGGGYLTGVHGLSLSEKLLFSYVSTIG
jgi:hypothetical protein